MRPLLADGIDFPILLFAGVAALVPLLAFEVFVEALVLKRIWRHPYGALCKLTFVANCLSLLAGIPTKFLNAGISSTLLPDDIPGYMARYPAVAALGSLVYFVVTVLVEALYAFRWRKREQLTLSAKQIWSGMLLANLATYAVLAPVNYFATRPQTGIRQFTRDTSWTSHPAATILFVSTPDYFLKSVQADGSNLRTVVPVPMADYLVSTDLDICLFRGTNGSLYFCRHDSGLSNLIWKTEERFSLDEVAFSPSGRHVAFADRKENWIEIVDLPDGKRTRLPMNSKFDFNGAHLAWSPREEEFYVGGFDNGRSIDVLIQSNEEPAIRPLEHTNDPAVLKCYGRVGNVRSWNGEALFPHDDCGGWTVNTELGLASGLAVYRSEKDPGTNTFMFSVSVRPGLLHIGGFFFMDIGFLDGCDECAFDANGYIYLLDCDKRRAGTLVQGGRFIQLSSKYEKRF